MHRNDCSNRVCWLLWCTFLQAATIQEMQKSCAISLVLAVAVSPSFAWGPRGHQIVANVAAMHLTPAAKMQVRDLLGNDNLAAIADWADEIKLERPETADWHFVDIPRDASGFSESRDCFHPDSRHAFTQVDHHNCVVDRIEMFEQILGDKNAARENRIEALKFLVHLVGDIHQPLHAIAEARGGNDVHVIAFGHRDCGRECNLHSIWDVGLLGYARSSGYPPFAAEGPIIHLNGVISREHLNSRSGGTPVQWANESFLLAQRVWVSDGATIDENYY